MLIAYASCIDLSSTWQEHCGGCGLWGAAVAAMQVTSVMFCLSRGARNLAPARSTYSRTPAELSPILRSRYQRAISDFFLRVLYLGIGRRVDTPTYPSPSTHPLAGNSLSMCVDRRQSSEQLMFSGVSTYKRAEGFVEVTVTVTKKSKEIMSGEAYSTAAFRPEGVLNLPW